MRPSLVVAASLFAVACGGKNAPPDARESPPPVTVVPPVKKPSELPPGTRSLRLVRTVAARLAADDKSRRIGTIAGDTRVGWRDAALGPGCTKAWYAVVPQGWVCGDFIEASTKPPSGVELPRLDRDEIVPGVYGKVVDAGTNIYTRKNKTPLPDEGPVTSPDEVDEEAAARAAAAAKAAAEAGLVKGRPLLGSVNVRQYATLVAGGKEFWKISAREDEWLPASAIREHTPSP